ncbi:hypothetical protein PENSTE_c004G00522 [Penicillium steckii]|uniref:Uncharacterized protein n=1 Tax=Penicillium steckii TaxID=303698 RepID=A0A1V6TMJ9_9EURO|nr:hypothetical protein PENSTE_c004G00522 [Penicillium steckii]
MASTESPLRSLVTTTLSNHRSPYIRREKLISRLKEIFGRKIEVEFSQERYSFQAPRVVEEDEVAADSFFLAPLVLIIIAFSCVQSRRRTGLDMAVTLQRRPVVPGDVRQAKLK